MQMPTSTGIPMLQNRQSYNLKDPAGNYTPFSGKNVTLVLYHPSINADLSFLRMRQTRKKATELILAGEMCWVQKKTVIRQRGSDSGQTQRRKHASTELPLSSNTKPFRAVLVTFQIRWFFPPLQWKGSAQWGSVSEFVDAKWKQPKEKSPQAAFFVNGKTSWVTQSLEG